MDSPEDDTAHRLEPRASFAAFKMALFSASAAFFCAASVTPRIISSSRTTYLCLLRLLVLLHPPRRSEQSRHSFPPRAGRCNASRPRDHLQTPPSSSLVTERYRCRAGGEGGADRGVPNRLRSPSQTPLSPQRSVRVSTQASSRRRAQSCTSQPRQSDSSVVRRSRTRCAPSSPTRSRAARDLRYVHAYGTENFRIRSVWHRSLPFSFFFNTLATHCFVSVPSHTPCLSFADVSGVPGTGKTATVTRVIKELEQREKFRYIELNGMKMRAPEQAYVQLWRHVTNEKGTQLFILHAIVCCIV